MKTIIFAFLAFLFLGCALESSDESVGEASEPIARYCPQAIAACSPQSDSDCYRFKQCIEGRGHKVETCVAEYPEGSIAWRHVVRCECEGPGANPVFCTNLPWGHPYK